MPYRPDYLRLTDSDCPSLEHFFALGSTLLDRKTGIDADMAGSLVIADRQITFASAFQQYGTFVGYNPAVPNTVADEPLVLASAPGTSVTSNEQTIAAFLLLPYPDADFFLSVTDESSNRAIAFCGGSSGTDRRLMVKYSQDGSTYNKQFRTTANILPAMSQTQFNTGGIYIHFASTYSTINEEVKIYINGYLVPMDEVANTGTWGIFDSTADLILGNYDGGTLSNQMPLIAGQVGVWSKVLTDREILALAKPLYDHINPFEDTYLGVIPPNTDNSLAYQAIQIAFDHCGSGVDHATLHHLTDVKFPHGTWYLTQSPFTPNTSSGGWHIQGAGRNSGISASVEGSTILRCSASWTGSSIALIEVRGSNTTVEKIAFYDSAGSPARVGVHLTRGPGGSGSAPSNLTVRNCSANGLVSLVKGGWDEDEFNCDFIKVFNCVVEDNCTYLFHCANAQGQIHTVEHCTGNPTVAMCYLEFGGPLYVNYCGTGGADLVRAGSLSPVTGHIAITGCKLDAGADADTLFFNGPSAPALGGAFVTVRDCLRTVGTRGYLGKSFHLRGGYRLVVENSAGMGGVGVEEGPLGGDLPSVSYINCQWYHGDISNTAGGYTFSAAYRVDQDPTVLLNATDMGGEGPGSGTIAIHNGTQTTRITTGSLPSPPVRLDDTPGAETDESQINALIAAADLNSTESQSVRRLFAEEYLRQLSPGSPAPAVFTFSDPVEGQAVDVPVNVSRIPGTVGKTTADITGIRVLAKETAAVADADAVYDETITSGTEFEAAQDIGKFDLSLVEADFGEGKLVAGRYYRWVVALSFAGVTGWIETDAPTRVKFAEDLVE